MTAITVVVETANQITNVFTTQNATRVSVSGMRGPAGPSGSIGNSFDFTQSSPALQWSISHNLGRRPIVELFSVGGAEIDADVIHQSADQVIVYFVTPTAGSARLI